MKPTDVRIRRADGTTLHCELVHLDPDADGGDRWLIANILVQPTDMITIAEMPPNTCVEFRADDDGEVLNFDVDWREKP